MSDFIRQLRAAVEKFSQRDSPSPALQQLLAEWKSVLKEIDSEK